MFILTGAQRETRTKLEQSTPLNRRRQGDVISETVAPRVSELGKDSHGPH